MNPEENMGLEIRAIEITLDALKHFKMSASQLLSAENSGLLENFLKDRGRASLLSRVIWRLENIAGKHQNKKGWS